MMADTTAQNQNQNLHTEAGQKVVESDPAGGRVQQAAPQPGFPSAQQPTTDDCVKLVMRNGTAVDELRVFHRDIPDLTAAGDTAKQAAFSLADDMAQQMESIPDPERRALFKKAHKDVLDFANRAS